MEWLVEKLKVEPGDIIVFHDCTPEQFAKREELVNILPENNFVIMLAPGQGVVEVLNDKMMLSHGWQRTREAKSERDHEHKCDVPGCTWPGGPSEKSLSAHKRLKHTKAGRAHLEKLHAGRKKG